MKIKLNEKRIHLIGISGCGMLGIAQMLLAAGHEVSGSDLNIDIAKSILKDCRVLYDFHDASNISEGIELVIYSTAISLENPELKYARDNNITCISRAVFLGMLVNSDIDKTIAVTGAHGKTTTTAMLINSCINLNLDISFLLGAKLMLNGSYGLLGGGDVFIAEADESEAKHTMLMPYIAVLNNISREHLSNYNNDFECLKDSFRIFISNIRTGGSLIYNADDDDVLDVVRVSRVQSFGFSINKNSKATIKLLRWQQNGFMINAVVDWLGDNFDLKLSMPGIHNIQNAMASLLVMSAIGVDKVQAVKALADFKGVNRRCIRFQYLTEMNRRVHMIDDYGHHPKEIKLTLSAVRQAYPHSRLVLILQLHRYSRVQTLYEKFLDSVKLCDFLVLTDIYSAGEIKPRDTLDIKKILADTGVKNTLYLSDIDSIYDFINKNCNEHDIVILQGAGDIGRIARDMREQAVV